MALIAKGIEDSVKSNHVMIIYGMTMYFMLSKFSKNWKYLTSAQWKSVRQKQSCESITKTYQTFVSAVV